MNEAVSHIEWVIAGIIALAGILMSVDHLISIFRKYDPRNSLKAVDKELMDRVDKHDVLLQRDLEHLQKHDKEISSLATTINDIQHSFFEYQALTLEALMCLLSKDCTDEEYKNVEGKIKTYLFTRK